MIWIIIGIAALYLFAISTRIWGRPAAMPKVFYAHRGLHDNQSQAPENSMAAFALAVKKGYGIELDVQMTADGQVVVTHDFDLKRICGIDKDVDACTYEELQQYPIYGSDQKIPLLQDVLQLVNGQVPLIVEIKYKNGQSPICEKTQQLLQEYQGVYCIESFHPQALFWYKKHAPHVCRGQLAMNYRRDTEYKGIDKWIARHLLLNFLSRPDFIAYDFRAKEALSKNLDRKVFGCPSVAWTIRSREDLEASRKYYDYFIFEGFMPEE